MSITGLTLLALAASGAAASGVVGKKQSSTFLDRTKALLTTPTLSQYRPEDYTTIESALISTKKTKNEESFADKIFSKLKFGHVLGTVFLAGLPIPKILSYFNVDDDSFWMKASKILMPFEILGTAISYITATFCKNEHVESMKNILDHFVTRYKVTGDKVVNLQTGAEDPQRNRSLDRLIMPDAMRRQIRSHVANSKDNGVGLNAIGPPGLGKSSTGFAIAAEAAGEGNAQVWVANKNIMEGTLSDSQELGLLTKMFNGVSSVFGLGRLTGETFAERIERLIANAVKHYRETGEPVIILLDEAHKLIGSKNDGSDQNDPHNRTSTVEELGPLFEDKLKKEMCKGVILLATSNSSPDQIAGHFFRRLQILKYTNPTKKERALKIEDVLKEWFASEKYKGSKLQKDGIAIDTVLEEIKTRESSTDPGSKKISSIGRVNLLKAYFDGDKEATDKAGYGNFVKALEGRNILHYESIEFAVMDAINNYESGNRVEAFVNLLRKCLQDKTKAEVENREHQLRQVKFFTELESLSQAGGKSTGTEEDSGSVLVRLLKEVTAIVKKSNKPDGESPLQELFADLMKPSKDKDKKT